MTVKFTWLRRAALATIACVSSNAFAITPIPAVLGQYALSWETPAVNEDGTPLEDLVGYYIYVGDSPDLMLPLYFAAPSSSSLTLGYAGVGYRYYGVAAINADGVESDMTVIALGPLNGAL